MSKEWDKANMKTLGVNLKREEAEAFKQLAEEQGTTVGAMLRSFIQQSLVNRKMAETKAEPHIPGLMHVVSYKNTDRLKHEVAFHNPRRLNPDGMLNDILDQYFAFAERVRG